MVAYDVSWFISAAGLLTCVLLAFLVFYILCVVMDQCINMHHFLSEGVTYFRYKNMKYANDKDE